MQANYPLWGEKKTVVDGIIAFWKITLVYIAWTILTKHFNILLFNTISIKIYAENIEYQFAIFIASFEKTKNNALT